MKRLIAAAVLFLFIIGICISGNLIITKTCDRTNDLLTRCREFCVSGDWDSALRTAEELNEDWQSTKRRLSVFVNHGTLDDIEDCLGRLPSYAFSQSSDGYLSVCTSAFLLLDSVIEDQSFDIDSFL